MQYQVEMMRHSAASGREDPQQAYLYRIHLLGNFVMESAEEFQVLMGSLTRGGMKKCALDLAELKYIDSTGIGVFINLTKALRAQGGDLVLMNVTPSTQNVFNLVKLHEFIPVFKSEKQVFDHLFARAL